MIHFVKRGHLDLVKYAACLAKADGVRIYAETWFLDAVCESWDALILNDYEAVMPLPNKRKFGLAYVYLAPWIQQLGVFSPSTVNTALLKDFLAAIPTKFRFIEMMLNASNPLSIPNCTPRVNYTLALDSPYKTLYQAYSKGRKSSIKQANQANLSIDWATSTDQIIAMFKAHKGLQVSIKNEAYDCLETLILAAKAKNVLVSVGVIDSNRVLIGGALFLKEQTRWVYLFSALSEAGRTQQAMSFLMNSFIEKHANTTMLLDFEGSMVPGIATFFKSFGSVQETYGHYKRRLRL